MKAKCLHMKHSQFSVKDVYLVVDVDGAEIDILLTHLIAEHYPSWRKLREFNNNREVSSKITTILDGLGAWMPKEVIISDQQLISSEFDKWWRNGTAVLPEGASIENQLRVWGREYKDAIWFKCTPRCYVDPDPIWSAERAREYSRKYLSTYHNIQFTEDQYVQFRDASLKTFEIPGGYINAYSFSRKPLTDPDIAFAYALELLMGVVEDEYRLKWSYYLFHK